ncbi:MAG: archaeoflavoprotein AfpA [Candidatus Methylarchaceae archaeon HK02M1]|nr:archaeoflavoprotein AfpA [Candidatus Methylarchaceae archaeon HK02M1]
MSDKRLPLKIAWGITGSGDYMPETVQVMKKIVERGDVKLAIFLSKSAVPVLEWYDLFKELKEISPKIMVEKGPNEPFIAGPLQVGKFKFLLVAPATANTVAKIVNGIADSLVTNAVSQAHKGNVPIYILPVDQETETGKVTTLLPTGEKIELTIREVDLENFRKLKRMRGITIITKPQEIGDIIKRHMSSSS